MADPVLSELLAAHRVRHLLRQHDRFARPVDHRNRAEDFQGKRVGTIFGTISIGSGLGSAFGSWAGGLIHDYTHGYNAVILFALVNVILGMIPFLVVPALRR